jgi:hypothetical protein
VSEHARAAYCHPTPGEPVLKTFTLPTTLAVLSLSALGLVACGESSEEKATAQVCSARSEISKQVEKLESLTISSSAAAEAKTSVEAIDASLHKIKEAAPNLSSARKEEVNAANTAAKVALASLTASAISAAKSGGADAALKSAQPQLKATAATFAAAYKHAFDELKC